LVPKRMDMTISIRDDIASKLEERAGVRKGK
jgi:hypothetical protein